MILAKEFYFVRHGQTDHNASNSQTDHADIPLNDTGRTQAKGIVHIAERLPIQTVCYSPLRRAKETKEILTSNLQLPEKEILDLKECSSQVWRSMRELGADIHKKGPDFVLDFLNQVKNGVNEALLHSGPVLIVAHGGVHFAICSFMGVDHEWAIDNCVPVHFVPSENGTWRASKLI